MSNEPIKLMTVDEIAAVLGVDRRTVYQHVERKRIPHRRLGRRILFSRAAIEAWLAGKDAA